MNGERFDYQCMARAVRLAERGLYTTAPNPRVGCVLAQRGQVIAEGWHMQAGGAHAEAMALAQAGPRARGATAYVTLEPCAHHGRTPPCADALVAAGVSRVVVAMEDPDPRVAGQGLARLREHGVTTDVGILAEAARALNAGFEQRLARGRPLVRVKLAMSLDGRTAMASGESRWITASAARRDVQRWRARSDAVLTGIGTVLADDPLLNVRVEQVPSLQRVLAHSALEFQQPLRVICDSSLRTPPTARLFGAAGAVLIACARPDSGRSVATAEIVALPDHGGHVDLPALLGLLAQRGVNEVHVEAGATLAGALLQAGLVDELLLYVAPCVLGSGARGLLQLAGVERLADVPQLEIFDTRSVGRDWRIRARVQQ